MRVIISWLYPDLVTILDVLSMFFAHACLQASDVILGDNCISDDGSKVPDCALYIDPDHYVPYYVEHSSSKIPF